MYAESPRDGNNSDEAGQMNDELEKKHQENIYYFCGIPVWRVKVSIDSETLYHQFVSRFLKEKSDFLYRKITDRFIGEYQAAFAKALTEKKGGNKTKRS